MKISEIVARIQHLYSKGVPSDDTRLTSRHIYNKMLTVRSRLLTQELNKRRKMSRWNFQMLPCVELIEASPNECDCIPFDGCKVLRSKYKIPKPLISYSKQYLRVTTIDGDEEYQEKEESQVRYIKGSKYSAKKKYYYIRNEYLYTKDTYGPRVLSVEGIFEDAEEVKKFQSMCPSSGNNSGSNGDCSPVYEEEFSIEADLIDILVEMCVQELVVMFSQLKSDGQGDSRDSRNIEG